MADRPVPIFGELPGINRMLVDSLKSYGPGAGGLCLVEPAAIVTLPVPHFGLWYHRLTGTSASMPAGSSTTIVIFSVPQDERWTVRYFRFNRTAGDNTWATTQITMPDGYYDGAATSEFLAWTSGSYPTDAFWPDPSGLQTAQPAYVHLAPLELEPGCEFRFQPGGAGASASAFDYQVYLTRTKAVRALAPGAY